GAGYSYLFLGPINLSSILDVKTRADVVFQNVGAPAATMGDINGDGNSDLVFVSTDGSGNITASIFFGGSAAKYQYGTPAAGYGAPTLGVADADRTISLLAATTSWTASSGAHGLVLDWNGDHFADLVLAASSTNQRFVAYGYSGSEIAAGTPAYKTRFDTG